MGSLKKMFRYVNSLNKNKFFLGLFMIVSNIGSKYVDFGFSKTQEHALRNTLGREILIFTTVFIGTNDVIVSILMTAAFAILSNHLFNEESRFCIISEKLSKFKSVVDTNNDNIISKKEEAEAIEILKAAQSQRAASS